MYGYMITAGTPESQYGVNLVTDTWQLVSYSWQDYVDTVVYHAVNPGDAGSYANWETVWSATQEIESDAATQE